MFKTLYDEGLTYEEIGKQTGKSVSNLCHFIARQGWTRIQNCRPEHTERILKNIKSITALFQKGIQIPEIAKQIGCCKMTVRKILKQQEAL